MSIRQAGLVEVGWTVGAGSTSVGGVVLGLLGGAAR